MNFHYVPGNYKIVFLVFLIKHLRLLSSVHEDLHHKAINKVNND